MKIGIVTYHRALNYGAVMQSLATRFVLEEMGHEVYYVDYWPDYHKERYALFPLGTFVKWNFIKKLKYLLFFTKNYYLKKRRIENFEKFFQSYIYPYCRPVDDTFDVVIYGSDQIWRKQKSLETYNPFYFGKNELKTKHHISYAASMGILPDNEADKEIVKELVSHLDKISVREDGLRQLLISLGYENVFLSLDPTLLLSFDKWNHYLPSRPYEGKRYVLGYMLGDAFDLKEIKRFACDNGLKLIILPSDINSKEKKSSLSSGGPHDFIRLIKNADFVFCSSFHGLAFSIIYEKQFYISFVGNSGRAESLLNMLGIKGRLITPKSPIPHDLPQIDYKFVKEKLEKYKVESLNFLKSIM